MIEAEQGTIDGQPFKVVHCMTPEEARKAGLPEGMTSYFMIGSEKVIYPGDVMNRIQDAAVRGEFGVRPNRAGIAEFHRRVMEYQKNAVNEGFKKIAEMNRGKPDEQISKEAIKDARGVLDNVDLNADLLGRLHTKKERRDVRL